MGKDESQVVYQKMGRAEEIADSFEWIITALILAFVFRAFVMEAFRIPTGSMADTLMGAHFRLCCLQCGYKYNYGFIPERYGFPADSMPRGIFRFAARCPSCGYNQRSNGEMPVSYGDRILVLKCIYEYIEPKRWDVVVFRNPLDPQINFIKRLTALPGETIEIIDGDVYINGRIAAKPEKVQNELWMPVYDNDDQPARPGEPLFNGHTWQQPFSVAGSGWQIDKTNATRFILDSDPQKINTLNYDTSVGNNFRAAYAYDDINEYERMPYCSDLMVRYYATIENNGSAGVVLSKYGSLYKALVNKQGEIVIERSFNGGDFAELVKKAGKPLAEGKCVEIKFANVDHRLILNIGDENLTFDLGRNPEDAGPILKNVEPQVKILGSGKLVLSHLAVFRDMHYINTDGPGKCRGGEGNAFTLQQDEFFMLGDNSPNSHDSRWWERPGKANENKSYNAGVVPRDYLVGKALFVYWPSGFRPWTTCPVPLVPDVGSMRFIYGGK